MAQKLRLVGVVGLVSLEDAGIGEQKVAMIFEEEKLLVGECGVGGRGRGSGWVGMSY